jgi:hypothetical protein
MLFNRDSAIQKSFKNSASHVSCPDVVSSRLDAHLSTVPSVRTTCHTIWMPNRPSIIRSDDVDFLLDLPLYREASVPACIRSDVSATRSDGSQYSTKLQILSKFIYEKIAATVLTMWIPVRTRFSLMQESQFKFNRLDVCQHGPDARLTDMELRIQLQPSGCLHIMVRTRAKHIWKLRVEDQLSGRPSPLVRTREALYGNYLLRTCDRPDAALKQERFSAKIS